MVLMVHRKLYLFNWLGILVTTCGLALVGLSSVFAGGDDSASQSSDGGRSNAELALFGDVLIVLGMEAWLYCCCNATWCQWQW